MTCLILSQCSRPDIQISISARMSVGGRSNTDACEGLSPFVGCYRISVQWFMLRGD